MVLNLPIFRTSEPDEGNKGTRWVDMVYVVYKQLSGGSGVTWIEFIPCLASSEMQSTA